MESDTAIKAHAARRLQEQTEELDEADRQLVAHQEASAIRLREHQEVSSRCHSHQEASGVLKSEAARRLIELGEDKDSFLVRSLNVAARTATAAPASARGEDVDDAGRTTAVAQPMSKARPPPSRKDDTELIRQLEAESKGIRRLKETHDDHIEHDRPLARRLAGGPDNC